MNSQTHPNPKDLKIAQLEAIVAELKLCIKQWKEKNQLLEQERAQMQDELKLLKVYVFGRKSERRFKPKGKSKENVGDEEPLDTDTPANESSEEPVPDETANAAKSDDSEDNNFEDKKRGKPAKLPKNLPREEVFLDIPEHEKKCPCCNNKMHQMGEDRSERLEFVPATFKVIESIRPKYGCRHCEQTAEKNIILQQLSLIHI